MRKYIRHPIDIPVSIEKEADQTNTQMTLQNCSQGGLCLRTSTTFALESRVVISMPLIASDVGLHGIVRWSIQHTDYNEIGIEFLNADDFFRVRMIEQLCYIKHYQKERAEYRWATIDR